MNYKVIIYILSVLTTTFAMSGIDFNKFIKQGKVVEANFLVLIIIFAVAQLVSTFIIDFLEVSKIL